MSHVKHQKTASRAKRNRTHEWFDLPVEQWIGVELDRSHLAPHTVVVGGYARARLKSAKRAIALAEKLRSVFREESERAP
jgi:hypothetical protein